MCDLLDNCEWGRAESLIVEATDPLANLWDMFLLTYTAWRKTEFLFQGVV
jgi:hypothetical protein